MQINSMKNKNVRKYLILAILTVVILTSVVFVILFLEQKNVSEQVLIKYNVLNLDESLALEEINNQLFSYLYIATGTIFVILFLVIAYFLFALNRNEKEIKNMRVYIDEIAKTDYKIDIENMSESEMSNLKNEIYKIVLELKEKSENLAKDRETLSNYLSDISHQIRTPLMAISSMVDAIIANEDKLDENTRKFIYEISRQLDQINWLVDNLLKMAQLDTKTVDFNKEDTNIRNLIEKIEKNMSIFLELKNQKLAINIDENIHALIDSKWMTEAIENIIKNCIEHSAENSKIQISAIQNPLFVQIEIKDNGSGISEEDLPRIFDKFYKGKGASNNSFGIGLSLAKSIIESQNGEIEVESEVSKGSTFRIKLYKIKWICYSSKMILYCIIYIFIFKEKAYIFLFIRVLKIWTNKFTNYQMKL